MSESLGIAGSGTIATGLAVVAARTGEVLLWARSEASEQRARAAIEKACARLDDGTDPGSVRIVRSLEELSGASYLVEAVVEDYGSKVELLSRLATLSDDSTVIATTTSSLSIHELAAATGHPERFAGLHVFNPVPRMELVELVFPHDANEETRTRSRALCLALGKTPVEVPDIPGFVVNRLLFPYLFSAVELMAETGLAAEDIDSCMTLGAGLPMGPLALLDFVGLDVSKAIGESIGFRSPSCSSRSSTRAPSVERAAEDSTDSPSAPAIARFRSIVESSRAQHLLMARDSTHITAAPPPQEGTKPARNPSGPATFGRKPGAADTRRAPHPPVPQTLGARDIEAGPRGPASSLLSTTGKFERCAAEQRLTRVLPGGNVTNVCEEVRGRARARPACCALRRPIRALRVIRTASIRFSRTDSTRIEIAVGGDRVPALGQPTELGEDEAADRVVGVGVDR